MRLHSGDVTYTHGLPLTVFVVLGRMGKLPEILSTREGGSWQSLENKLKAGITLSKVSIFMLQKLTKST